MPKPIAAAVLAVAALVAAVDLAQAASVQDFYKGRTVTILVGVGVGGGTDAWARTVGKYIGRHIPGNPSVITVNMPGAAGLKMTNYLYNAAPKDGSVFGLPNGGIALDPILGTKGANFDPLKMNWIGSPNRDTTVCVARKDGAVKSIDDLRTKELVVGASGAGGNTNIFPMFFAKALGMKIKVIQGYKGTADILLAIERGEVMGMCSSYEPLTRHSIYRQGKIRILFQAALKKNPDIDAPLPTDFIKNDTQRQALAFFLTREEVGRPFIAPPGVPAERVQALRRALDAIMTDSGFVAEAKKRKFNIVATTGEELFGIIKQIYQTPKSVVRLTEAAIGRGK
jgi:tripartite-type tricarboxylate transporter receptor subunit TctC